MQRRDLLKAMAAFGVYAMVPAFARGANGAKKYAGVTLNVSTFSTAYPTLLRQWLPEFEALTGAKVNLDTPAFPVYNQRADLELSTKGTAYDVVNVTFIYSSRWINSGWLTPLDEFIANPNLTSADWDVHDFLQGGIAPETGRDGKLYGIPWVVEGMLAGSSRFDLVSEAGFTFPDTTDDLVRVLQAVNKKQRVAGYVTDSHYGWTFIPYLQAFGGNVFRNPPDDLFPTLDTPEAVAAADYFARLIREFGPNGGLTYTADQSTQALKLGRVNFSDSSLAYLAQLGDPASSRTLKTASFGQVVQGPRRTLPRHGGACAGHTDRLEKQRGRLGVYPVGAFKANHPARRAGRVRFADPPQRYPFSGLSKQADHQRRGFSRAIAERHGARGPGRIYEVPHGGRLSAGGSAA